MNSKETRKAFLDFFRDKQHKIVPSAPMVIKDDPTLMFTNAGMNQFKNIILGNDPIKYTRVADTQKCLRVSGKHNDLEEVGHDTYHHTMFEMLGNWSFGDYFKKEAISWAWEFLTEVIKLDKDRLYVTVFEGSKEDGLSRDDEAAAMWEQFLPKERIIDGNKKDNFWEMGDVGPCGPCSEIHIDIRPQAERDAVDGLTLVNGSHPQVIEIWNLVFMQYDRKADGSLVPLPNKVIDTGMGFERLCMALQGKSSNYDTDIFQPIIQEIAKISGISYGQDVKTDVAMRVIADHIRTIAFSIADGQLPSNAKAGYVIRRILRRAVRYGYTFLGQREAFMYRLVPILCSVMGDNFTEIISQRDLIEKVIKEEEEAFLRTLETGIRLLEKNMPTAKGGVLSGGVAFTLYDTYGFPLDLTELILRENGMTVDVAEFDSEMKKQKERARNAATVETDDWVVVSDGDSLFVGYDQYCTETKIIRYRKVKQKNKEYYQLVLSRTPFYAEKGGQVGDSGKLTGSEDGSLVEIFDTKTENNLHVHLADKLPSNVAQTFTTEINTESRLATARNHTATHILHETLREVLGKHVEQKGSYVCADNLRFDFSHFQKMTDDEIRRVETIANRRIRDNYPLEEMRQLPIAEARAMGAIALFGEKYGETVRVVKFGSSVELCGGTHVSRTGDIGIVKIVAESSVAAGVRRIEAITGEAVEKFIYMQEYVISSAKELFNNTPDLLKAIQHAVKENKELQKRVEDFSREKIASMCQELLKEARTANGIRQIRLKTTLPPDMIKTLMFQLRNTSNDNLFAVIGSVHDNKPSLTVLLSDDLVAKGFNAVQIVRQAAKHIQGGGGGQPFFAQAGGKNPNGLDDAIAEAFKV